MRLITKAVRRLQRSTRDRLHRTWRLHPGLARRVLPVGERLQSVRARVHPRRPERPLERVVFEFARAVPQAAFVQVGAHDGTQLDPLREAVLGTRWHGIMVEPVPYVFERLAARYRSNPRVILENVAVADEDGTRELHFLAQAGAGDDVWKWYDALGSFKREVVLSHGGLVGDIESRLVSVEVPCVTFETLCDRNGLDRVDLVQIDTEGYDREILGLIDFGRLGVDVVIFEHLHLDAAARASCRELLAPFSFEQVSDGMDTIAVSPRALAIPGVRAAFDEAMVALGAFEQ
jgi:FkbM family methyltransferase